jgi:hypothetical protein
MEANQPSSGKSSKSKQSKQSAVQALIDQYEATAVFLGGDVDMKSEKSEKANRGFVTAFDGF